MMTKGLFVGYKKLNMSSMGKLRRSGVKVFAAIGIFGFEV